MSSSSTSLVNPFAMPGMGTPQVTAENQFWWGPNDNIRIQGIVLDQSTIDAGSTPTTNLRQGLLLGQITATGNWKHYSASATDGSQVARMVLYQSRNMIEPSTGVATNQQGQGVYFGNLKAGSLFGFDENARRQLQHQFVFDDFRFDFGAPSQTMSVFSNNTTTSANFTQPAVGSTVSVTVGSTSFMSVNQEIYIQTGGWYMVSSITSSTVVVLTNVSNANNAAVGTTVNSASFVTLYGPGSTGAAAYTVQNGLDNDKIFTTTGAAAATTFTLPATVQKGNQWTFFNTVNQNMTITAPAGKLIALNNAAATNITFSTASNKIGASVEIIVDDTGGFYMAIPYGTATVTVS